MRRSIGLCCMAIFLGLSTAITCFGVNEAQADQKKQSGQAKEGAASAKKAQKDKAGTKTYRFFKRSTGKMPRGWIADVTGTKKGTAPRWEVKRDKNKNVMAQLESGGAGGDFPVCLKKRSSFKDGTVTVHLKPISGVKDQAGGLLFRAKDKDNFYIARANATENNVSFYFIKNGKRTTMKYWEDIPVKLGEWHKLEVEVKGFNFKVRLNNKLVGEIEDTKHIFPGAGMVGFWTKADSVTYFENCIIKEEDDTAKDNVLKKSTVKETVGDE